MFFVKFYFEINLCRKRCFNEEVPRNSILRFVHLNPLFSCHKIARPSFTASAVPCFASSIICGKKSSSFCLPPLILCCNCRQAERTCFYAVDRWTERSTCWNCYGFVLKICILFFNSVSWYCSWQTLSVLAKCSLKFKSMNVKFIKDARSNIKDLNAWFDKDLTSKYRYSSASCLVILLRRDSHLVIMYFFLLFQTYFYMRKWSNSIW